MCSARLCTTGQQHKTERERERDKHVLVKKTIARSRFTNISRVVKPWLEKPRCLRVSNTNCRPSNGTCMRLHVSKTMLPQPPTLDTSIRRFTPACPTQTVDLQMLQKPRCRKSINGRQCLTQRSSCKLSIYNGKCVPQCYAANLGATPLFTAETCLQAVVLKDAH